MIMAMTISRGAPFSLILLFTIATYSLAQTAEVPESPAPLRELFIDMDANNDRVVEPAEVPESGQQAFRTLLKYGDANHDGKLDAGEYRELLMKVNWGQVVPPEQLERRFRNLDKNQDGKLDAKEFQGGAARFGQLDRNHDGFLSRDEIPWLRAVKSSAQPEATTPVKGKGAERPRLQRLRAMDKDGDGRVSREEFTGRPAMFDRLDVNHDGFLDPSDRSEPKVRAGKQGKAPGNE